jgi:fibronectin-binding autotransporter adhesin
MSNKAANRGAMWLTSLKQLSRAVALAIAAALLLFCMTSTTLAAIAWSGDVSPADPGIWTSSTDSNIGSTASGVLTITGGSELLSRYSNLGYSYGSAGTVTISGDGSAWTKSGYLAIGRSGNGTLLVETGGQVSDTVAYLGYEAKASGTATITGNSSTWTNSGLLFVGSSGNGILNIEAGGQVSNAFTGFLGFNAGSTGIATVTGTGSQWSNSTCLFVGYDGSGTLTVANGGMAAIGQGLFASMNRLLGNGAIVTNGAVLDADVVFDATQGAHDTLTFGMGGVLTVNEDGGGVLGAGYKGYGTLRIAGGLAVTSSGGGNIGGEMIDSGYLGYYAGSTGVATVTGTGSKWTNNSSLHVGRSGSGTLKIEAGGQVSAYCCYLGDKAGSAGTVTIKGDGSRWNSNTSIYVGYHGNGALNIESGGMVSNAGYYNNYLGYGSGTTGTATITGSGSKWACSFDFIAGFYGSGILNIKDGGQVSNNDARIGYYSGSTGAATIDGDGSCWTNSGYLYVGLFGNGTMNVQGGGLVSAYGVELGWNPGSTGTATIAGPGSKLISSNDLTVGSSGNGTLRIEAGGQVSNPTTAGILGMSSGSTGTVMVTGTGSAWSINSAIYVGYSGSGMLNVEAGGLVSNTDGFLGDQSGSSGSATVTGANSTWISSGKLTVGNFGNGTLSIGNGNASGGLVTARTLKLASDVNAVGVCSMNGGTLQAQQISCGFGSTTFNWNDGTIRNYDVNTNLTVAGGLVLNLAATGTHAFNIDSGRTGSVSAILSDVTSGGTLTKLGGGSLTLARANTYTGSTTISAGTLALGSAGSLASPLIDVGPGATFDVSAESGGFALAAGRTLKGSGTIAGGLTINGIHAPGNSPGIETVRGNYNMLGTLQLELMGTTAGTGYDQVLLSGTGKYSASLGGTLSVDWTGMNGSDNNTTLWILKNDTLGTLSGTFGNYVNGATLGSHDGREWFLWYGADSATGSFTGGNDVVIAAVPEPTTLITFGSGVAGLAIWACRPRRTTV